MKLRVMTCLKYVKNLKNKNEESRLINCVVQITSILENNNKLIGFSLYVKWAYSYCIYS